MAEQGAVCGAFADIMACRFLSTKTRQLWSERNYSGSVIRRAAALEGRGDLEDNAIDELLNRYSMWLLNNLANPANAEILSWMRLMRHKTWSAMSTLYAQADNAIVKNIPLASCATEAARHPPGCRPQRCNANEALSQRPPSRRPKPTLPP